MKAAMLALMLVSGVSAAEPMPYTLESKTGLQSRTTESNLYNAVQAIVSRVAKAAGLSEAEKECAKATAAQRFLEATVEAAKSSILGEEKGADDARRFFGRQDDDWCDKAGGKRGAEVIAPHVAGAKSVLRPFFREEMERVHKEMQRPLTPAEVAAIIAAGLLSLPMLLAAGT